ncbi:MAG TPA: homoserine kinase [Streptosporangiaceae bacterium]|nr:homoserine kinase [Streptosporangiaceae bacterium]
MSRWPREPVTVRAPATSANLGPGFDSFGLALGLRDSVTARVTASGITIEVNGAGAETATAGEKHLVIRAMRTAFARIGQQPPGIALLCQNEIPQGFGLGSSAGAIVAGLLAARALAGPAGPATLPDDAVLRLATRMEGHPDNVAACLAGGLTIAWEPAGAGDAGSTGAGVSTRVRPAGASQGVAACGGVGRAGPARAAPASAGAGAGGAGAAQPGAGRPGPRVAHLTPLPDVATVLCVPETPVLTAIARQALPAEVPHAAAAANAARTALLVTALTSQPDLLLDATEDFLHQHYRAAAMPATAGLIARLRAAGIPAVVSGAGPSVLAFTRSGIPAAADVAAIAGRADAAWQVSALPVDTAGATVTAG